MWEGHKIWKKISLLFWCLFSKSADLSKQEGDLFKFLWSFQKIWTLLCLDRFFMHYLGIILTCKNQKRWQIFIVQLMKKNWFLNTKLVSYSNFSKNQNRFVLEIEAKLPISRNFLLLRNFLIDFLHCIRISSSLFLRLDYSSSRQILVPLILPGMP